LHSCCRCMLMLHTALREFCEGRKAVIKLLKGGNAWQDAEQCNFELAVRYP
jgi:hypothetical protein